MEGEIRGDETSETSNEPRHAEPINPEMLIRTEPEAQEIEENTDKPRVMLMASVFAIAIVLVGLVGLFAAGILELPTRVEEKKVVVDKNSEERKEEIELTDKDLDKGDKLFGFSLSKPAFAQYKPKSVNVTPSVPKIKLTSDELINLEAFEEDGIEFTSEQLKALEEDGIYLTENNFVGEQKSGNDDFSDTYSTFSGNGNKYYREAQDTIFVSSDVALHLYHILIDRSFQKIEEQKFHPMLKEMTETLVADSLEAYENAIEPEIKDTFKRLSAFYLIPLVVLDAAGAEVVELQPSDFETYAEYREAESKQAEMASQSELSFSLSSKKYKNYELSDEIYELASAELELIAKATGVAGSPIFTPHRPYFSNDYSQFKPRSHYTKNDYLKSYFIAMMWYGRMGFSLDSEELTRDALAITGQVSSLKTADGDKLADLYSVMSVAIEFFVGEVDDLTPYEYTKLIKEKYGDNLTDEEFVDSAMLQDFIASAINDLPKPRIVSESIALYDDGGERDKLLKQLMQFRFMGQRFTPDAYVLNNLTQGVGAPDPETGQNLPSMTTALMPVYVISNGNNTVKDYIDEWVVDHAPDSDKIIDKKLSELKQEFAGYDESTWNQNIYWSWLNTYRSLLGGYGNGFPSFMTTDAWQLKNMGTVLGSYTELKHDTLLYAKQSYAELGGGGSDPNELPPVPKGYVEADYDFWSRITALAKMTREGLVEQDLMPEYFDSRYKKFVELSEFYSDIVKQELGNEVISDEDFEKLRVSGKSYSTITSALPGEELTDKERRAGIIADIHTDAVKSQVLYEATGKPFIMYVAVKDKNGTRLTRGLAFNHYEFTGPLTKRYADEDWQARVYDGSDTLPEMDKWSEELMR